MNNTFKSFADRIAASQLAAAQKLNEVLPVYGQKIDHAVAVSVPVAQEYTARAIGETSVFVVDNFTKLGGFADRLAKKAAEGYKAAVTGEVAPKTVVVKMTEEQAAAWRAQQN